MSICISLHGCLNFTDVFIRVTQHVNIRGAALADYYKYDSTC